jgi:hypothetical protein
LQFPELYHDLNALHDIDLFSGQGETPVRRRRQLPKGVLRGCAECADCQKVRVILLNCCVTSLKIVLFLFTYAHHITQVVARWNPSGARRPVLDEAPVFHPSEEVSC